MNDAYNTPAVHQPKAKNQAQGQVIIIYINYCNILFIFLLKTMKLNKNIYFIL